MVLYVHAVSSDHKKYFFQLGGGGAPVDTIRRDEVNAVLANQRELVAAARDIKNFVADVHNKVSVVL